MLSDIQHSLINSASLRMTFDLTYLLLPAILVYMCLQNKRSQSLIALCTALFNIMYNYYFSTMSFVSIEVLVGWMIVPMIFIARKPKDFYFTMHAVRILFILFFFSAALWKIRAGGIFNIGQMSGILLSQHASYLLNNTSWFSQMIEYLIEHEKLSYLLYLFAFLAELCFITGLFTRRFDKYLILIFCLFAVFNYFLMEINYFTWLPFMGCLYFSKYTIVAPAALNQ